MDMESRKKAVPLQPKKKRNKEMTQRYLLLALTLALMMPLHAQQQRNMKAAVEYLASEELGGRFPESKGDTLASAFLTDQLRSMKLKPILKEKGAKAFFHDFSFSKKNIVSDSTTTYKTHNIVAVLPGKDKQLKNEYIVVGSHYDHLGMGGQGSGSRRPDTLGVHPGADDNASSDAVVLELAKYFKKKGTKRSIIFMFFGAEEQGLVGSKAFVEWMKHESDERINLPKDIKGIVAMVNLDMVGRMRDDALSVSGTGTSTSFKSLAEQVGEQTGLHISCTPDGYGPSDQASFVAANIPVLYLTTGGHMEYHTPADKPATLNYDGMQQTLTYAQELISRVASMPQAPDFINVPGNGDMKHAKFKVTLGLMPDVTGASTIPGLRADIVVAGKPAHNAGIKSGDIIQEINDKSVKNIEEYMERLAELKAGTVVPVKVLRGNQTIKFQVHLRTDK